MTTADRLTKILVQRYKLDPAQLTPDQPLGSLGIDSLGMAELMFFIEEEFGLHLPAEGVAFGTLGEAVQYVDGLLATQSGTQKPGEAGGPAPRAASRERGA